MNIQLMLNIADSFIFGYGTCRYFPYCMVYNVLKYRTYNVSFWKTATNLVRQKHKRMDNSEKEIF